MIEIFEEIPAMIAIYEIQPHQNIFKCILANKIFRKKMGYESESINSLKLKSEEKFHFSKADLTKWNNENILIEFEEMINKNSNKWMFYNFEIQSKHNFAFLSRFACRIFSIDKKNYLIKLAINDESQNELNTVLENKINNLENKIKCYEKALYEVNDEHIQDKILIIEDLKKSLLNLPDDEIKNYLLSPEFNARINEIKYNERSKSKIGTLENEKKFSHSFISKVLPNLSKRELEICSLLVQIKSSKEISTILNISSRTVDLQRYNIRKKLGLKANEDLTLSLLNLLNSYRNIDSQ